MPVETGMWRMDGSSPRRLAGARLPDERGLEDFLEKDVTVLGERLMVIGRQVRTPYGKLIDLLALDIDGNVHVLELKRDRTPREVVAQVLDYGSWVTTLDRDEVIAIANEHLLKSSGTEFEAEFEKVFETPPPDEINGEQRLTIVATELDDSSERIVQYLASLGVPVNAVFFSHFEDEDRRYLARSWLVAPSKQVPVARGRKLGKRAEWNGRDWFVSFGDGLGRSWKDGQRYGFVSAGGADWFSRTLRGLPVGARVFVYLPKAGYVAVGETLREARRFDQAEVHLDGVWTPIRSLSLNAPYRHVDDGAPVTDENAEYVVPVRWFTAVDREHAFREPGLFANQNSACKLRQEFTLERLAEHFNLDGPGA